MANVSIKIWHNQSNTQTGKFAEEFAQDLNRCLTRFMPNFSIQIASDREPNDCGILILSANDLSQEHGSKSDIDLFTQGKTFYLSIDHLQDTQSLIGEQKQLILFCDKQYETGETRLFRRDNQSKTQYWEKVTDIAVEIHTLFSDNVTAKTKDFIYISLDDISHNADRENLMRDLNDLGYEILPKKPFSSDINKCSEEILSSLSPSRLIIHIIPPVYNIHFVDHRLSLTEHQCNISAKFLHDSDSDAQRIIWLSSAYDVTDEENQVFIEKIQRDHDQAKNTIVLKSSIEDLKKHCRQILSNKSHSKDELHNENQVYIITDDNQNGIHNKLIEKFNVMNLKISQNISGITFSQHLKNLALSTYVIVSYSSDNQQWLRVKANDILKSKGMDLARSFKKILLFKQDEGLETDPFEDVFTEVISDLDQIIEIPLTES